MAERIGITADLLPAFQVDSTNKLLEFWHERDEAAATVKKLLFYLEEIERFDIIDDTQTLILSPPVSPVSTGPYIPISECITGRSPTQGSQVKLLQILTHPSIQHFFI